MARTIQRLEWNCTGLLDKYGEMNFTMTDQLQVNRDEVSPQTWRGLSVLVAKGSLIFDKWPLGSTVFQAVDDEGVKALSDLQYKLEP